MGCGDLSDAEWELIGPLLPSERGLWARPAGENLRFLNGMLHVLRVGCPLPFAMTGTVVSSPWMRAAARTCASISLWIGISAWAAAPT